MSGARWLANQRAAHTRALGAPQAFPLIGDGDNTRGVLRHDAISADGGSGLTGAALADARYRDWFNQRASGTEAFVPRATAYEAPPLALTADDAPAAVQTRLTLPARSAAASGERLARATLIIRGLVDEFADLFPDELAAAVAWLKEGEGAP